MARFEDTNGNFREDIHWISRIEGSIQTNRKIIEKSLGGMVIVKIDLKSRRGMHLKKY